MIPSEIRIPDDGDDHDRNKYYGGRLGENSLYSMSHERSEMLYEQVPDDTPHNTPNNTPDNTRNNSPNRYCAIMNF